MHVIGDRKIPFYKSIKIKSQFRVNKKLSNGRDLNLNSCLFFPIITVITKLDNKDTGGQEYTYKQLYKNLVGNK